MRRTCASPMTDRLPATLISPRAITVLGTYRCTAECEDCCFDSNPRIKHRLSLESIVTFLEQTTASFPQIDTVVFSGGGGSAERSGLWIALTRHSHSGTVVGPLVMLIWTM